MSFILDALKKSEKERQRGAVPGIGGLPVVVHRPRTSAWVAVAAAGLAAGLAALAWAWWRTASPLTAAVRPAPETAVTVTEPAAQDTASAARELPPTATRSLASEATRIAAASPSAAGQSAAPTATQIAAPERASGVVTPGPISILEARAAGMAVPELTLELLVFSDDPAKRFVYINSAKYVEGETLGDGPRLVEITPEGAVLSYRGQNFLLPRD